MPNSISLSISFTQPLDVLSGTMDFDTLAADGVSKTTVTVTVTDFNGNPLSGRLITLSMPSTAHAKINSQPPGVAASATTNAAGKCSFSLTDLVVETVNLTATEG